VTTTAESYSVKRSGAKAPISTHPAFPAIVALWFSALLGLGSLVLPVALLEKLVTVTGLASFVPSAAPPLGFTARVSIALGGSIAGALIGLVLARQVARSHSREPQPRRFETSEASPRRPISADELDEEGLGTESEAAIATKRRSLAMAEDNGPSTFLQTVPLPGAEADAPSALDTPIEDPTSHDDSGEPLADLLELGEFADFEDADEHPVAEADAALDAIRSRIPPHSDTPISQDQTMTDRPNFHPLFAQKEKVDVRLEFGPPRWGEDAADEDAADPLPFAAPSLRRSEPAAYDEEEPAYIEDEHFDEPAAPQLSVIEASDQAEEPQDGRPLEELGLVQLAARLGASLNKRKAQLAAREPVLQAALPPLAGADRFEAAEAEDAARAIADFFGSAEAAAPVAKAESIDTAPAVPAPLRAVSLDAFDEIDEDAFEASLSLPLAGVSSYAEPADEEPSSEFDESDADDGEYSSLLAMKNPFARQQEFVRIEEPEEAEEAFEPTVTFPAPAPEARSDAMARPFDPPRKAPHSATSAIARDPSDAERSLRDALATLQRMSGAA
jgi:hypothetical protein